MARQLVSMTCISAFVWVGPTSSRLNAADNADIHQLGKERIEIATKGFESATMLRDMWVWSHRLLEAELALCHTPDNRITALENQLRRTEKLEKRVTEGKKTGVYSDAELMEAKYYRLDNMYRLAEEKARKSQASTTTSTAPR